MSDKIRTKGRANAIDVYVGQQLKIFRGLTGKSQETLGDEVDITFQQIQKYENGANRISASRLYALAKNLDRNIDEFFDGYDGVYKSKEKKLLHLLPSESILLMQKILSIKNPERQKAAIKAACEVVNVYANSEE